MHKSTRISTGPVKALAKFLLLGPVLGFGQAQAAAGVDNWPVAFNSAGYQVQVYAPQPESLEGYRFTARSAVSLRRNGGTPVFGAIWGHGVLEMDRVTRLGKLSSFTVVDARFPDMDDTDELLRLRHMLSEEIPRHAGTISLDWLVAALESEKEGVVAYANTPPEIIYRERPGVLVFIDGEPILEPLERGGGRMERVVNTPFLLLRGEDGGYNLFGSGTWFRASNLAGPWVRNYQVSKELRSIAERVDSTAALEATAADGSSVVPEIVVRTTPAVLLDLDGPPKMKTLPGSGLLYATNTNKELFLDVSSQEYYLLASGRWFATRDPATGPWTFRSGDQLPPDFARIPEGSAKDGVLAHVPGTNAAREAVLDASIPQTAQVDRRTASLEVEWDGEPEFEWITGTEVELALNASAVLLRIGRHYHALDNAVWFDGPSPHGPWSVSTEVPDAVGTIPPESQAYNARYVQVYDHTPEVVYVGYTPGYLGSFVQYGTVIHGTGFYYPPPRRWRPRPFTWGMHMYYDPWYGWGPGMGWGWSWYYPTWYGWGWGAYRPMGWGWGWCGPYGYFPPVVHHHHHYFGHRPSTTSSGRVPGAGGRPGVTSGIRSDQRARTTDLYAMREREGVRPTRVPDETQRGPTSPDRNRPATRPADGPDHFIDREGNIYRGSRSGVERYQGGRWNRVTPEGRTPSQQRPAPTTRPQERPPVQRPSRPPQQPQTRPAPAPSRPVDPARIQHDRSRGTQRMNDFRHHQQRPVQPSRPPSPPPARTQPQGGGARPAARPPQQRSSPPASQPAPSRSGGRP
jgi:hypothetical protein